MMNKEALIEEARLLGLDVRGATAAQLRVLLRTAREDGGTARPKLTIRGLSSMKKDKLLELAQAKGIPGYKDLTVEELRLRLQGWSLESAAATGRVAHPPTKISGSDVVNFGRYRGETYLHILRQRTQYASWVVHQLESSPECSPALARLGRYLAANFVQAAMGDD
jgi:hypothetical protein